jgi:hypothetical protein
MVSSSTTSFASSRSPSSSRKTVDASPKNTFGFAAHEPSTLPRHIQQGALDRPSQTSTSSTVVG